MKILLAILILCGLLQISIGQQKVIKFGRSWTYTTGSPQIYYTSQMDRAYRSWEYWVNNVTGGIDILGEKYFVQQIVYNDGGDCQLAELVYERLITFHKVDILFAPIFPACHSLTLIAEKYGIPYINAGDWILPYRVLDTPLYGNLTWTFTMLPDIFTRQSACLEHVFFKNGARTYISMDGDATIGFSDQMHPTAASLGMKNLTEYGLLETTKILEQGCKYLDPYIDKWIKLSPDVLFSGVDGVAAPKFVECIRNRFYRPKALLVHIGPLFPEFRNATGWRGTGIYSLGLADPSFNFTDPVFGSALNYAETYTKRFNSTWSTGYDATFANSAVVVTEAIKRAGSFAPEDVRRELLRFKGNTLYGPIEFNGYSLNRGYLCLQQTDNGGVKVVYPPDYPGAQPATYPENFEYDPQFLWELGAAERREKFLLKVTIPSIMGGLLFIFIITAFVILYFVKRYHFIFFAINKTSDTPDFNDPSYT